MPTREELRKRLQATIRSKKRGPDCNVLIKNESEYLRDLEERRDRVERNKTLYQKLGILHFDAHSNQTNK